MSQAVSMSPNTNVQPTFAQQINATRQQLNRTVVMPAVSQIGAWIAPMHSAFNKGIVHVFDKLDTFAFKALDREIYNSADLLEAAKNLYSNTARSKFLPRALIFTSIES